LSRLNGRSSQARHHPEALATNILREQLPVELLAIEPQDEWERRLFGAARSYGVSLSDEALSRENLYD
jgi:hypothetical protein